jgi:hypothetical protein
MLPERGGAGYFTLLVADRLADLNRAVGRAVTLDELVTAVYDGPGIPWTWIGQRYQAQLIAHRRKRSERGVVDPSLGGFDPALGYRHPDFDITNPDDRRAALTYVIRSRVADAQRGKTLRRWVIRHPDGTLERNPDQAQQPRVYADGRYHDWSEETRHTAEEESRQRIADINRGSLERRLDQMPLAARATVLRWLAERLPVDRSISNRLARSGLLNEIGGLVGADPDAILSLMHQLTTQKERTSDD